MDFTRNFKELNKHDANIAGGKGASLGEMTQSGIPVPPGFVILSGTFDHFLKETDLTQEIDSIIASVDHKAIHTVDAASEKIRGLIEHQEIPEDIAEEIKSEFKKLNAEFVAVRSSATAEDGADNAWAGQLESYLNTTDDTLMSHVRKCWSSLFTPRAIFYRFEKQLHATQISVAVVVQKMVQSEVSGIAFSVHPITEDPNQLIIEAGYGLGEAIVSGSITPDSYVIEKEPRKIIDINIAEQKKAIVRSATGNDWVLIDREKRELQKISNAQILELSEIIVGIENHYDFPCDIEWAYEEGKFYIVQSRPITTLTNKEDKIIDKKVTLSKIFSRERPFFYFCMWNDSDRMGFKKFAGHEVQNNLFLREENNNKGSVWYDLNELQILNNQTAQKIKENPSLFAEMISTLDQQWQHIGPLLTGEKKLETIEDFDKYYSHLTQWWSAMTVVFNIPGIDAIDEDIRNQALARRTLMEKYSDAMHRIYLEFWKEKYAQFWDIAYVLLPHEAVELGRNNLSESEIKNIRERLTGFSLFNNKTYPLSELETALKERDVILEKEKIDSNLQEIKGTTAYPGLVQGKVRLIRFREQIPTLQEGEILVTEMTDPDFVPAMKKAVAVITDEGGVMCHAAIVARELKKPCIIGTKIATQVLKDGDLVQVDAENGVITILSKADETLVLIGNRRTDKFQAELRIKGWSEGLKRELGVGYKKIIIHSTGEHFADQESENEVNKLIASKDFKDFVFYSKKMSDFGGDNFSDLFTYFLITRRIAENIYEKSSAEEKKVIEKWRNDETLFTSLDLYREKHPQDEDVKDWTMTFSDGEIIVEDKIIFEKIYTRDTTYIMQELWAYGCSDGIEKEFGWKNPCLPGIIHHMNQGSIEIWENLRATQWLEDTILKQNTEDLEFIDEVLKKYKEKLSIIHKLWKQKILPIEDLEKLIELSKEAITYFIPYYYSAVDDRTPKDIREKALEMRNKDEFFAENDMVIRDSLTSVYPELKGYETTLFFDELESTQTMSVLKARKESSFIVQGKEKFAGSLDEFSKIHPNFVFKKEVVEQRDITEIKGEIAQKGKVTGKVKIVRRRDQIDEVTPEDIIVSPMTTPDFLPAMKVAKAFVTDEGGITCHAGIVARELKKPCIIGTKIATQLLKDGMEIEVDADRGIVTILK